VSAQLMFGDAGLSVRLSAEDPASEALLGAQSADLRASLAAAGLPAVTIARQDHGGG